MQTFILKIFLKKIINRFAIGILVFFIFSYAAKSQSRSYGLVYSDNIRGGTTMFGNTLLQIVDNGSVNTVKMNDNSANGNSIYGNDLENMQCVDIDGNSGYGSTTRNSSSSDLILPAGTNTIILARLYWGGRVANAVFDLTQVANKIVKIRKGTINPYSDVMALGIDDIAITPGYTEYQAYADITSLVQNNGAGTYEVGNVPLSTGSISGGGNNGGWCIVVVYENNDLPYNSVRLYDGFQEVNNGGNPTISTVILSGLDVPSGMLDSSDAEMGVMAWEGDANLYGDFLTINGNTFSNATNQANNPWNGTITNNGVHVTTKNPNYTNQMGIDIDRFDVGTGYGILPNATNVTLQFGTSSDKYYPGVFTFSIKMKDPTITLDKTVADANDDQLAESGEVLTYTLQGSNNGPGDANHIIVTDTLPNTVTYLPGTLKVISSPGITAGIKTDNPGDDVAENDVDGSVKSVVFRIGTGANATQGGTLKANETYQVQFQVTVNDPGTGKPVPSIMNIARVTSLSDAGVPFVDDGTAIINPATAMLDPEAGPLPVTLENFSASLLPENEVKLYWCTSMEINCSRFVVQRSYDGNIFSDAETVAANGTTNLFHSYSALDNIYSFTGSMVYYRLEEIDINGKENFSKVIALRIKTINQLITVSPNPFSNYLNINVEWNQVEMATEKIFAADGKEVFSKILQMNKGYNYIKITDLSNLNNGTYILELISPSEKIIQKIFK
ncbi:MAG TPA: T9SS type A sorting domain-containing protein [Hanamia sp.]|nr:T9SS type A sorting domain-containing protein [Hanamia sp.]